MQAKLNLKIISPEKILWQGECDWISSENIAGPFSILPYHANFITVIENKKLKFKTSDRIEEYSFERCVLYNKDNKISIYVNL